MNDPGNQGARLPRTLFMIPTELEMGQLADPDLPDGSELALCGFGPIVAAAKTSELLLKRRPDRVVLIGIAGSYSSELAIGSAYIFDRVACFGIGAGQGDDHIPADQMVGSTHPENCNPTGIIDLDSQSPFGLLTTCSAAGNEQEVAHRLEYNPDFHAEDMEGFAVAIACQMANVPLTIIRGISNRAGDRDHARWVIGGAMRAAWELAVKHAGSSRE